MLPNTFTAYLPIVINDAPPFFGVTVDGGQLTIPVVPHRLWRTWVRWMGPDASFDPLMQALQGERKLIATNTCPHPYRLWPERTGSPPKPEFYPEYVDFVIGLANQYRPWAIEVWNEPDVPNTIDDSLQRYFGAWVEGGDFRGAGRRYGELLRAVYPWLHGLGVQVVGGALVGAGESSLEFLAGMLETGECDAVSFHCYLYENDEFEKVNRSIRAIKSVTNKDVIMTEIAVITGSDLAPDTESLRQRQAEFMRWLIEQGQYMGVPWFWYSADGAWRQCGLNRNGGATPAYYEWERG